MTEAARTVVLSSEQLRILAHPLRFRLLIALRVHGPSTATVLAQRLGTNSGQTSYHLRQLAEVGLIEEEPARGRARERWWRAAHDSHDWSVGERSQDPDDRAAGEWLTGHIAHTQSRWLGAWLEARHTWPREWQEASELSDVRLELTPDRASALVAELHAVIERYGADEDSDGNAKPFIVQLRAFPRPEVPL